MVLPLANDTHTINQLLGLKGGKINDTKSIYFPDKKPFLWEAKPQLIMRKNSKCDGVGKGESRFGLKSSKCITITWIIY